ncbi:MAG: hydantoinase/oxoprolinase family protein [Massilia sp.]|nr:hydantoinase/oxoprolinase family protein [Massilia sp.]
MSIHVATDVGGTFTDLVLFEYDSETMSGRLKTLKVDTTPGAFEKGVIDAISRCGVPAASIDMLAHGATIVINVLTERRGAKTALITTRGFRDVLEIARGNRPDLFNLNFTKPASFVERQLRFEVSERVNHRGEIQTPAQLEELAGIAAHIKTLGVEAIAICCLHAYRNPANEQAIAKELRALLPDIPVVASSEISREWREYERSNTTVASAYVSPVVSHYLGLLRQGLSDQAFVGALYLMQSNGGMTSLQGALRNPVSMVESGAASGMLAARALGDLIGEHNIIALDVGGTTAKCTLISEGRLPVSTEYHIERTSKNPGYPIQTAVIDLVEIGNGGGSIASVDAGGRLQVGPKSAGAKPGPVAYGRGGVLPTTTDANLFLGRIDPQQFLQGAVAPDMGQVEAAFAALGDKLGLSARQAAQGVLRIANANMVNALKLVSTNKGYDPRDFVLMAFGGGGALHAIELAEELGIPRVIIPANAAVFSAWGMLLTDIRRDYTQTRIMELHASAAQEIIAVFTTMEGEAMQDFRGSGMADVQPYFEHYVDLRYAGQEHTVKIKLDLAALGNSADIDTVIASFHADHEKRYTFRLADAAVELVNFHLVAGASVEKPKPQFRESKNFTLKDAQRGTREAFFEHDGVQTAAVYAADFLEPGMTLVGPAIVQDSTSSMALSPGHQLTVDAYGNLIIELREATS